MHHLISICTVVGSYICTFIHFYSITENVVEVDVSTETGESLQSIVQVATYM